MTFFAVDRRGLQQARLRPLWWRWWRCCRWRCRRCRRCCRRSRCRGEGGGEGRVRRGHGFRSVRLSGPLTTVTVTTTRRKNKTGQSWPLFFLLPGKKRFHGFRVLCNRNGIGAENGPMCTLGVYVLDSPWRDSWSCLASRFTMNHNQFFGASLLLLCPAGHCETCNVSSSSSSIRWYLKALCHLVSLLKL